MAVTAGWMEREAEMDALQDHMGREVENLRLFARSEELFEGDAHFLRAYRGRRVLVRELQELYRVRLGHLMDAYRELGQRAGSAALLAQERSHVLDSIRALDEQHLKRLGDVSAEFDSRLGRSVTLLEDHRARVAERVASAQGVLIAGGHAAVLINRLRLFGLAGQLGKKLVVAWSAGAMAMCERVVLFHDDPPHGMGYPEIFGPGLGLCRGLIALPDAERRLRLGDEARVALLARRFAPLRCAALNDGAGLLWNGRQWLDAANGAMELTTTGKVERLVAA